MLLPLKCFIRKNWKLEEKIKKICTCLHFNTTKAYVSCRLSRGSAGPMAGTQIWPPWAVHVIICLRVSRPVDAQGGWRSIRLQRLVQVMSDAVELDVDCWRERLLVDGSGCVLGLVIETRLWWRSYGNYLVIIMQVNGLGYLAVGF